MEAGYSADIGCVRLTERCLHSDPPTAVEVAAARDVVRERLGEALRVVPVEQARTWVGVAGTMTTLSALAQRMTTYDPDGDPPVPRRVRRPAAGVRGADRDDATTSARRSGRCTRAGST